MTIFYIVNLNNPTRPIRCVDGKIVGVKWSWAELSNQKRHLIGSSAFFTEASAFRTKYALLKKILKNQYLLKFEQDIIYQSKSQLKLFETTNKFDVLNMRK